jgi:hypothetical protein
LNFRPFFAFDPKPSRAEIKPFDTRRDLTEWGLYDRQRKGLGFVSMS